MCHISQAMKVENMLKIKEEFDYKSLSRRLEVQVDKLIVENERQQKTSEDEVERINVEAQNRISEVERSFTDALEVYLTIYLNITLICCKFYLFCFSYKCVFGCKS